MNAVEFVKKFGIDRTKYWIKEFTEINKLPDEMINIEFLNDLKHLIESHDLILSFKTKKNANAEFMKACMRGQTARANMIKKAIEDVEACQ
jgi:hypothetical protein